MCEHCDRLDELVAEVNRGERTFDQELLATTLTQNKHVLDEVIADCFSAKPLHEILDQAAITMSWMGHALSVNARTVARASRAELDRLAKIGQNFEAGDLRGHLAGARHGQNLYGIKALQQPALVALHRDLHVGPADHTHDDIEKP